MAFKQISDLGPTSKSNIFAFDQSAFFVVRREDLSSPHHSDYFQPQPHHKPVTTPSL